MFIARGAICRVGRLRAVRFHEYGTADVLRYDEVADPVPGSSEVVIRVAACSIQHSDLDVRAGQSRFPLDLPHTLGLEYSGEIVEMGSDVSGLAVGDRVVSRYQVHCGTCRWCRSGNESLCDNAAIPGIHCPGGYAEYAAIDARGVARLPEGISLLAAAAKNSLTTAWHALTARADLHPGEWVLVNAAGSGVGSAGVQIARLLGAVVIASAGSSEKLDRARAEGADFGIDYGAGDLRERVLELTEGRGVDVVLECVGGDLFSESLSALSKNGRLVVVGAHGGEVVPLDLISVFRNQWTVCGSLRSTPAELDRVLDLILKGDLRPVIDRTMPLEDAAAGHRLLEERLAYGKVLLEPKPLDAALEAESHVS